MAKIKISLTSLLLVFLLFASCKSDEADEVIENIINDKRSEYVVSTLTETFDGNGGLTVDANDFIYVANFGNNANGRYVSIIDPNTGEVTQFADGLSAPSGNIFDKNGNLIQSNFSSNSISQITPEGKTSILYNNSELSGPVGVVFDQNENLYVCNWNTGSVSKIEPNGTHSYFAVDGTILRGPNGLTIDDDGNLYVANWNNSNVIKITPDGTPEIFVSLEGSGNSNLVFGNGVIYALSHRENKLYEITLDGEISIIAGSFIRPNGIGLSQDGSKIFVVSRIGPENNPVEVNVIEKM